MNLNFQKLVQQATLLTRSGHLQAATASIRAALSGIPADKPGPTGANKAQDFIDIEARVLPEAKPEPLQPEPEVPADVGQRHQQSDQFIAGSHTEGASTLDYKLYVPPFREGAALPLVVMLHGCTQNPDDFADGTGMNALAREHGFYVLYPAQSRHANSSGCWNWFKHNHQSRGRGEAALLASMTLAVIQQHGIDSRRIYIAGLSAGGAMAAIVAAAYPEIFAAVGVHSGLAVGAAGNVAEALAAMKSGAADIKLASSSSAVPTIVFHGDQDRTVHPRNGDQVSEQMMTALHAGSEKSVQQGNSNKGRRFTRTCHLKDDVKFAELWVLHGAGHAWSGGNATGSYTDPSGPDASSEMLRFFSEHVKSV